jgi:hypothetical protein
MSDSWLEAFMTGEGGIAHGVVEDLSFEGLYLRTWNQNPFLAEERVRIDLYLRESNRRYILLKVQAKVIDADGRGVGAYFGPMALADHKKLRAIIDFVSVPEGSEKDRYEEILFTALLEDYEER